VDHVKHKQAQQYSQLGTQTGVDIASPHRLIQMLLEGALGKIALAKRFMIDGSIAEKGEHISWSISIISGLRGSLDAEKGGEIAKNLDSLYEYMERRLLEANIKNNTEYLDEVSGLLREIKSSWDAIGDVALTPVQDDSVPPPSLENGISA